MEEEGGLELLAALIEKKEAYNQIIVLAEMVIENCQRFRDRDYNGVELDG